MKPFPHYPQLDQMDCGPTCLRMVAKHYDRSYTVQSLREKAQIGKDGVSLLGIAEAAEAIGFRSMGVKVPFDKLAEEAPLPCIVHWQQNHFVVIYGIEDAGKSWLSTIKGGHNAPKPDTNTGNVQQVPFVPPFQIGAEQIIIPPVQRPPVSMPPTSPWG